MAGGRARASPAHRCWDIAMPKCPAARVGGAHTSGHGGFVVVPVPVARGVRLSSPPGFPAAIPRIGCGPTSAGERVTPTQPPAGNQPRRPEQHRDPGSGTG